MYKILIFGGTSEGRLLAQFCAENHIHAYVSVTTEYGARLIGKSEFIRILTGKMDFTAISEFVRSHEIETVIDATHPYAEEATKNIKKACDLLSAKYYRIIRKPEKAVENAKYFDTIHDMVSYLNTTEGNILITTGSKNLKEFCGIKNYPNRCIARILPLPEIIEQCDEIGFAKNNIIAEKGPFTVKQNERHIRKFNIRFLVTKDSGSAGCFIEKVEAAQKNNAEILILKRPQEKGIYLDTMENIMIGKQVGIIGIGMNRKNTLTNSALEAIKNADALIGAKRMTEPFSDMGKPVLVSYDLKEISEFIRKSNYDKYAVLMSGDCGFFSGGEKILPLLSDCKTEVICGISSPVYLSSKINIPWSDWHFTSLHGTDANIVRNVCAHEKTFFLLGGKVNAAEICRRLCEYGLHETEIYIGENLAYDNEKITYGNAKDLCGIQTANLSVMLVVNKNYEKLKRIGIPDHEFIRSSVPMTKSEIRSVCISKLEIENDSICWDIGSGSGSVSVEMAVQCTDGKVYSVDKSENAIELTKQNSRKFGCDNIITIHDNAENIMQDLPDPDRVFIGGSGGHLAEIIKTVYKKNPNAVIAVTAVTLETLERSVKIFDKLGISSEITQIAVTRTKKVGAHTMLTAENPVFITKGGTK
ncbi:MAG: precorrin-6A reductase [Clostridium sp.]|nr:precorrin-6A reductase [Clostridium sp.]MCM1546998.1 precorrin-6A reductase [Ruminococcus sp.]